MIFGKHFKVCCTTCLRGHRSNRCNHLSIVEPGTEEYNGNKGCLELLSGRGRPRSRVPDIHDGKNTLDLNELDPNSSKDYRFILVSAELKPGCNEICSRSGEFKYDCDRACCMDKQTDIFIDDFTAIFLRLPQNALIEKFADAIKQGVEVSWKELPINLFNLSLNNYEKSEIYQKESIALKKSNPQPQSRFNQSFNQNFNLNNAGVTFSCDTSEVIQDTYESRRQAFFDEYKNYKSSTTSKSSKPVNQARHDLQLHSLNSNKLKLSPPNELINQDKYEEAEEEEDVDDDDEANTDEEESIPAYKISKKDAQKLNYLRQYRILTNYIMLNHRSALQQGIADSDFLFGDVARKKIRVLEQLIGIPQKDEFKFPTPFTNLANHEVVDRFYPLEDYEPDSDFKQSFEKNYRNELQKMYKRPRVPGYKPNQPDRVICQGLNPSELNELRSHGGAPSESDELVPSNDLYTDEILGYKFDKRLIENSNDGSGNLEVSNVNSFINDKKRSYGEMIYGDCGNQVNVKRGQIDDDDVNLFQHLRSYLDEH